MFKERKTGGIIAALTTLAILIAAILVVENAEKPTDTTKQSVTNISNRGRSTTAKNRPTEETPANPDAAPIPTKEGIADILTNPQNYSFTQAPFVYLGSGTFSVYSRTENGFFKNMAYLTASTGCVVLSGADADIEFAITSKDLVLINCDPSTINDWVKSNHPEYHQKRQSIFADN